jgi:hypothetical protein
MTFNSCIAFHMVTVKVFLVYITFISLGVGLRSRGMDLAFLSEIMDTFFHIFIPFMCTEN